MVMQLFAERFPQLLMCLRKHLDGIDVRQADYKIAKVGEECERAPQVIGSEGVESCAEFMCVA